jgi:P-type Ca2+ transporter type 2C
MSHSKNVPSINVFTSEAPTEPIQTPLQTDSLTPSPISPSAAAQTHSRSPSDPNYLSAPSPILVRPVSPTSFTTEEAPPSPTLSASSVHFKTTTDLRGRPPGDGMGSLQAVQQHGRKNSAASFQTITEPDHSSHGVPPSSATSITAATSPTSPTKKAHADKGDGHDPPPTIVHINPADDHTDPTPFAFKPYDLAALVDPKTLGDLDKMGGAEALCAGLGTNRTSGLSAHSLGQGAGAGDEKSGGQGSFAAPLSDRQRVYGTNTLPTRPSKSLLQLMWLALKDKVLVR